MGLGVKKLYICSWKKNDKFKIIKLLGFDEINKLPTEIEVEGKTNLYNQYIDGRSDEEIRLQTDFLKYKINEYEETKKLAFDKMNNYIAVMLFLIPLLLTNISNITNKLNTTLKLLFTGIIIYNLINIMMYLLDFYKVKGFIRSRFSDLKQSNKQLNKLAESYYSDWYAVNKEAPFFVSYVTNIENYIKYFGVILLITFCTNSVSGLFINSKITMTNKSPTKDTVCYVGFDDSGQVYKQYSSGLLNLYSKVEKENIKQIIIIKGVSNNELLKKRYELILNSIKMFNSSNVDIKEIDDVVEANKKNNYIKIITIGGK
ncbi:hypothetical protein G9F71_022550 [Clostridium sp. FP2]|uniref:hypothetical protein n=1 Tax=Clostridium sp. FP2 TaxID=2724481 RepID=UPI001A9BD33F|nr:hypothetical protein [Clostridium sp. FP2]MBZ9625613.1 hypothetical protein [Clostridium sp. FP2]